jgi:hypothetical protein
LYIISVKILVFNILFNVLKLIKYLFEQIILNLKYSYRKGGNKLLTFSSSGGERMEDDRKGGMGNGIVCHMFRITVNLFALKLIVSPRAD